jgi:ADP-heptose:LPS heptosyltransferase
LAIVLTTVSHSITSDSAARLSGARWIVGSSGRLFPGTHRNFMYNIEVPPAEGLRHQTLRNLDYVQALGADVSDTQPRIYLTTEEAQQARQTLQNLGWKSSVPSVGLHLGAGKKENRWPIECTAELADRLDQQGIQVVVTCGLREDALVADFISRFHGKAFVAGAPPIRSLAAQFQQHKAMVVNDTGMLHLAAACGAPLVAVFGPTDPQEWCPLGSSFLSVRGVGNSVTAVTVDQVWEKLRTLLS